MSRKWFAFPYLIWMAIFIVVPLILIFYYAFFAHNPDGSITFTLEYMEKAFEEDAMLILSRSLTLAAIATLVCLILGYPVAYIISKMKPLTSSTLSMLFIIPMWLNFLLRTYAWKALLDDNGIINQFLSFLGFERIQMLYTDGAVVFGLVYTFLPFMILPIFNALSKMNKTYIEAAEDLGANKFRSFLRVVFPLSMPGVISGITMVFMPAITTFVVSSLLGGSHVMMYGDLIEFQFMRLSNWGFGSALSVIMLLLMIASMAIMRKYDKNEGGGLF